MLAHRASNRRFSCWVFLQEQVASLSPNLVAVGIEPWAPYCQADHQSTVLQQFIKDLPEPLQAHRASNQSFSCWVIFLQGQVASLSPNLAAAGIEPWVPYSQEEHQSTVLQQVKNRTWEGLKENVSLT